MSLEDFQLIDDTHIDTSNMKKDWTKVYHQDGAQLNDSNQTIDFIFGENNNYHQVGNCYFHYDITVRRDDGTNFVNADEIRMINNAFAYHISELKTSTTGGTEIEINKFVGPVSTIMRVITSKDGDLTSCFDKIDETQINNTTLKQIIIDDQQTDANKGKIVGNLPLEHLSGFYKTFKKITKGLGFHIIIKTADLQNLIYTTIADDINVTINRLYLYVPTFIPDAATQTMFNKSIQSSFTLSFDSWRTDRRIVNTGLEFQVDIGSASNINSPKYLIAAHQTQDRSNGANKTINNAIFDNLDVENYFVEIDGVRYPKDGVEVDYETNNYLDQYRDLKLFFKEYVGEPLLSPFISYKNMKNEFPIQVIDLRYQVDHVNPKKIQLFEKYRNNPDNARLFIILIRHRQIKMVSDGNKITGIQVI